MRAEDLLPVSARRALTDQEIAQGLHRDLVGGRWDEIGREQLAYLKREGLRPEHRLLDVGCGALRAGVHLIAYLDPGNYYGVDANPSLLHAGRDFELPKAGIPDRNPQLRVDDEFDFAGVETRFDFAWAYSVFTHLPINMIERCLVSVARVLVPGGRFYASYRSAPTLHHVEPIVHPDQETTYSDRNPYHYNIRWFEFLIRELPLRVQDLGWLRRPEGALMLGFTKDG